MKKIEWNKGLIMQCFVFAVVITAQLMMYFGEFFFMTLGLGPHGSLIMGILFSVPLFIGLYSVYKAVCGDWKMPVLTIQCIGAMCSLSFCIWFLRHIESISGLHQCFIWVYLVCIPISFAYHFAFQHYAKRKIWRAEW